MRAQHPTYLARVSLTRRVAVRSFASQALDLKWLAERDVTAEVGGEANVKRLRSVSRDFRTDTITIPTDAQLLAGLRASRGDDVELEDPDTAAFEARVAALAGKEAGLLCASATGSNQLAVRSLFAQPPHSVVVDARAHHFQNEAGGAALFSQATTHTARPANGLYLTAEDIEPVLQLGDDVHMAPTRLIVLENTMDGVVVPDDVAWGVRRLADPHGIKMHLDGARAWNAAAAAVLSEGGDGEEGLRTSLSNICAPFDTASLCLSKSLGAPLGSREVVARARWFRKMFGGAWRQSGALAAAADWAITHHFPRLRYTHELARRLAAGLEAAGCRIVIPVQTSMVFFDPAAAGIPLGEVEKAARARGITVRSNRLVVHHQTDPRAVEELVDLVRGMAAKAEGPLGEKLRMGH
ncbi:hypothetical protein CC85DRAFT_270740 [Cutaneotrichosporon oleaginosum]|uniref:Aromatic amino acid beta-eliminating lyase/threonine aldolase domain-containing protein n=1 Tax=Cutaneotrichosporon oleaginosum TaxID=879819 RepID=A0A0J1BA25_9TREE|nr:uncharacterized protein CC85DRAFT_270740 [Cutaneotrichosporon oleaginosum]KLT44734.1 hypothetical protein CC85DRAFT_270740 [Cutaneotrichosporon oleaginosum]